MVIVTEKDFIYTYVNRQVGIKQAKILKKKGILPLYPSPVLGRIVGHLVGDGNLSKDKYVGDFKFYGPKRKLQKIKIKIFKIFKIKPKLFYKRKGGFVLKYNNCMISRILNLAGVPRGDKVRIPFRLTQWICNGNDNIKRNFLIAICDDELSRLRKNKQGYMDPLRLKFNKKEKVLSSGIKFLEDIRNLFFNFGIKCSSIKINNDKYVSSDNEISRSIYFNISTQKQNLLRFVNQIGSRIGDRFTL